MTSQEKVKQLRDITAARLQPMIDNDYVLLDLPYHSNVGDVLIWQGTLDFLSSLPYSCLSQKTYYTDHFETIPQHAILLLHGGGNFGDVWREHQEYRLEVIRKYPDHKIIMLPQSVQYNSEELLKEDAKQFARHTNVTICARDNYSYDLLSRHFKNKVILVPDMAFSIHPLRFESYTLKPSSVLVKRTDLESKNTLLNFEIKEPFDTTDWPAMTTRSSRSFIMSKLYAVSRRVKLLPIRKGINRVIDRYAYHIYRNHIFRSGKTFLAPYSKVYSTRLHAAILSVHYGKEIVFIDNSYGKNSRFYDTWLSDLSTIKMIRS
ncbi:MAG: polysaccharide pyruvyl transferase family protein [Tannerellaceae bacterium]